VESETDLLRYQAFKLYCQQYPDTNLTIIAEAVERNRSNVSRWAKEGRWEELAKELRDSAEEKAAVASSDEAEEQEDVHVALDQLMDRLTLKALDYIDRNEDDFEFTSASQVLRFLDMLSRHEASKGPARPGLTGLEDSRLPGEEADAIRAGALLLKHSNLQVAEPE
jgi:hypothetical protein